jgi:hypothetical protein
MCWVKSGFELFNFGSSQILSRLGSNQFGFRVIRVWIGSNFRLSDLRSSRVSVRLGSDRVGFQIIWSRSSRIRIVHVRIGSDSDQFDFLKKSDWIGFRFRWVGRTPGRVEFCHIYGGYVRVSALFHPLSFSIISCCGRNQNSSVVEAQNFI